MINMLTCSILLRAGGHTFAEWMSIAWNVAYRFAELKIFKWNFWYVECALSDALSNDSSGMDPLNLEFVWKTNHRIMRHHKLHKSCTKH